MLLPRVVLIDIDGTLIGKVGCIACEFDVAHAVDKKKIKTVRESVISRLRYGIIRPHFHAFCKHVQQSADREAIELFIYTASEAKWAAFLVPCIEAALNVKFNRPLFTRNHCIGHDLKKSVTKILPTIFTRVRKKYPALMHVRDMYNRVILVDNTPYILGQDDAFRLVSCPTYSYYYIYDVLASLDVDTLHRRFAHTIPVLVRYGLYPADAPAPLSYQEFAAVYYTRLGALIASQQADNARNLATDTFWRDFLIALRLRRGTVTMHHQDHHHNLDEAAMQTFDAATVRSLNASIRSTPT